LDEWLSNDTIGVPNLRGFGAGSNSGMFVCLESNSGIFVCLVYVCVAKTSHIGKRKKNR
jgi:hypothetical protein